MGETILEIRHLSKSFGDHLVLRDIDFTVEKGDVTSIIGASGSGKSTLLRCINLLETPTGGEILYHGKNVAGRGVNAANYRSHVGMVFQSFNLFNNMTVLENCMVGQIKVLKKNKEDARKSAMDYLEKVGSGRWNFWSWWAWQTRRRPIPPSSPAARSSGWPSPVPWLWTRKSCSLTNPPPPWTRKWWARFSPSCRPWPTTE